MAEDEVGHSRLLLAGLVKLAPGMGHATGHRDLRAALGEAAVCRVGVGLQYPLELRGQDVPYALRGTAGFPSEDGVASGFSGDPQVADLGFSGRRGQFSHIDKQGDSFQVG